MVILCCVDAIETRRRVWEAVRERAAFFADGRMAAEVVRVLASGRPALDTRYPRTLFTAGEAYAGSCTAKSTIYSASIAAGLMIGQFARWLRGQPVVPDQTLNLLAAELTVTDPVD
jgi:sulfur carrier protein ThiS adenylyltransferase